MGERTDHDMSNSNEQWNLTSRGTEPGSQRSAFSVQRSTTGSQVFTPLWSLWKTGRSSPRNALPPCGPPWEGGRLAGDFGFGSCEDENDGCDDDGDGGENNECPGEGAGLVP